MSGIFEAISNFARENSVMLTTGTAVSVLGGGFIYYVVKKVVPETLNKLLLFVTKLVAKMFGVPVEGVSDMVQKLPIMDKMEAWEAKLQTQNELKLIELKNKLVSPKLSDTERIAYIAMYDKILLDMGAAISSSTKNALEAIERAASAKLNL